MAKSFKKRSIADLQASLQKSYGSDAAIFGGLQAELKSIPTGSLALDYELGTGGWQRGTCHTVFGPQDIGKSSMIGLSAVRNTQALDLNAVWIALERPSKAKWKEWASRNGVDMEALLVLYPNSGEEAMSMLVECSQVVDVGTIVFDSIGAMQAESEIGEDGKMKVGGASNLISWGLKQVAPNAWNHDIAVILLNQVRQDMNPRSYGGYVMPGGEALKFFSESITQLRPGKERYMVKRQGTEIMAGRQIIAHVQRNKGTEGTGHKAIFDYFFMETTEDDAVGVHGLGIDSFTDIINTAKRCGVISQAGAYYDLPNGKRVQGMTAVQQYLIDQPDVMTIVREEVLKKMLERNKQESANT
jgi:recombination protein RecA